VKNKPNRLSREELIQKVGVVSVASVLAGVASGAASESDATIISGPWNLSMSRLAPIPSKPTAVGSAAKPRKFDPTDATPVDLILTFHRPDDIYTPHGFTLYAVYFVGIGKTDMPVYIYGTYENGQHEDDGHGNSRKLNHPVYIAMYTSP
jgi:hypothetical protein